MRKIIALLAIAALFVISDGRCIASSTGNYTVTMDSKLLVTEEKMSNQIMDLKKTYEAMGQKYDKELLQIRLELKETSTMTQANEKNVLGYLSTVELYTGFSFALITILLVIGFYKVYIDHKGIYEKLEMELKDKCQALADEIEKELQEYSYFLKLKMLLLQEQVDPEEVYYLISERYRFLKH